MEQNKSFKIETEQKMKKIPVFCWIAFSIAVFYLTIIEFGLKNVFSQLRHEIGPFTFVKVGDKISYFERILWKW